MAPSLEETTNGQSPVDTPVETPFEAQAPVPVEAPIDGPVPESNGNGHVEETPAQAVVNTAGAGAHVRSAGPPIPGPLGIESASLKGKVALVTGAGRGIGREMALELGRRGAKIVVNYANSSDSAEEVVAAIRASGSEAVAIRANVSVVKDIIGLFAQAVAHFGELNIVCSNSGVVTFGHVKDVTEEEYDRVMNINTRGQFFVAREAYKHLSVGGRLIMMGSITGQAKGVPKHTVYSGSKGAIETFVRCMAIDFGDKKITVNCVAPGGIRTDMYHKVCREYIPGGENLDDDGVDEYAKTWSPLHRVGLPIDVARTVCFLASQDGEWINGKVIGIDGGACM